MIYLNTSSSFHGILVASQSLYSSVIMATLGSYKIYKTKFKQLLRSCLKMNSGLDFNLSRNYLPKFFNLITLFNKTFET